MLSKFGLVALDRGPDKAPFGTLVFALLKSIVGKQCAQ